MQNATSARWSGVRRFTRRQLLRGGAAVAVVPLLASCRSGNHAAAVKPSRGGNLTVRLGAEPVSLDPAVAADASGQFALSACLEALLGVDAQSRITPLLATAWENPDARTYLLKLRPGVRFHDGTPLTADAVLRSLSRVRGNAAATASARLAPIERIETPDQQSLRIILKTVSAPFIYALADPGASVISPAFDSAAKLAGLATDLSGAGTGPFHFGVWTRGRQLTLPRNPDYWGPGAGGALPYLDNLTLRFIPNDATALTALRQGQVDAFRPGEPTAVPTLMAVRALPALRLQGIPNLAYACLFFNGTTSLLGDARVRRAISSALDRSALVAQVFPQIGSQLDVIYAASSWVSEPGYHLYATRDLTAAKAALAQVPAVQMARLRLLLSNDDPRYAHLGALIASQLGDAGLHVTSQSMSPANLGQAIATGNFDLAHGVVAAGYDPGSWLPPLSSSDATAAAISHADDVETGRLTQLGLATFNMDTRASIYRQAQRLILEGASIAVLYGGRTFSLTSAKVQQYPVTNGAASLAGVWKSA